VNKFIVIDGIELVGKGVAIRAIASWAASKKMKVYDLLAEMRAARKDDLSEIPLYDELTGYDMIISAEPTYSGIGRVIRTEMIRKSSRIYSPVSIATAFSIDREVLYRRLLIDALKAGKIILQDRSFTTSLVYQPLTDGISKDTIMGMPGNLLAIEHAPGLVIIPYADPFKLLSRYEERKGKVDNVIYETLEFQKKAQDIYLGKEFKELMESFGSRVVYVDNNPPKTIAEFEKDVIKVVESFLSEF